MADIIPEKRAFLEQHRQKIKNLETFHAAIKDETVLVRKKLDRANPNDRFIVHNFNPINWEQGFITDNCPELAHGVAKILMAKGFTVKYNNSTIVIGIREHDDINELENALVPTDSELVEEQ